MRRYGVWFTSFLFIILHLTQPAVARDSRAQQEDSAKRSSSEAVATFQASTRMVTLEVVVKDRRGNHVTGLTAADFQVFEQTPSRGKQKYEQKIAAFREVRMVELANTATTELQTPAGVYTNQITLQNNPVPPTILLVDGLNTTVKDQPQIHVQMLRMLKALPRDVPVAVFLLADRLRILQDLTTDPRLLQVALGRATASAGVGVATIDPRDDPNEISAQYEQINSGGGGGASVARVSPEVVEAAKEFEQMVYAAQMDRRVNETIDALVSLARHVGGYPGRKNVLWISTTFPIHLRPLNEGSPNEVGRRDYWERLRKLGAVLSEAKVAVYPMNPAGVQTPNLYGAGTRPRDLTPQGAADTLSRETLRLEYEQDTMEVIAKDTGGQVCTGDNDLGDCIHKAVDDSSAFYEIAYYPDWKKWNGEYRTITVIARQPQLHLAYRQGYFAKSQPEASPINHVAELRQAACEDYLDATSIVIHAKSLPPDSPESFKFHLTIDASDLTLTPATGGGRDLSITVAVCTFDRKGKPLQLMSDTVNRNFTPHEYQLLINGGLPHEVSIPGPKPAAVRLLVEDLPSGRIGSVSIRVEDSMTSPAVAATEKGAAQQAATPH